MHLPAALVTAALALAATATPGLRAQPAGGDRAAVERAALDYLEGFYEGDSTKHIRSVRPEVYKYGFSRSRATGEYAGSRMSWAEFHDFTRQVRTSGRVRPAGTVKEVQVFEVLDQTASVKVTAYWGVDYLLLGKFDGRWMITHVLWQTPPPA